MSDGAWCIFRSGSHLSGNPIMQKEDKPMTKEYMQPEVIEIGEATDVILGLKPIFGVDEAQDTEPHADLDD